MITECLLNSKIQYSKNTQHSKNEDHGIQSHHFEANRWGKKMETVTGFIFLGSKITAGGDCSYDIKRRLLLEEKL